MLERSILEILFSFLQDQAEVHNNGIAPIRAASRTPTKVTRKGAALFET